MLNRWKDFIFAFSNRLVKKFNLEYITITIKIGEKGKGVTDVDILQHYKAKDAEGVDLNEILK